MDVYFLNLCSTKEKRNVFLSDRLFVDFYKTKAYSMFLTFKSYIMRSILKLNNKKTPTINHSKTSS